jgi:hypothetical protein
MARTQTTVTNGVDTVNIALVGHDYDAANFQITADVDSSTLISYVLTGVTPI